MVRNALRTACALTAALALASCTTWVRGNDLAREYYNIGNAFYDLERFDRAADYYRRALALDSSLAPAGFNLARVYADSGRYTDSIAVLRDLLATDPDNILLRETLAFVLYLSGQPDRAVERYSEVLALSPFNVNALYNLGRIAEEQDRTVDAIEFYRRAERSDPNDPALVFAHGRTLIGEDAERGAVVLERFLDTSPTDPNRLVGAGDELRRARYFLPARRAYEAALQISPDDADALFGLAAVFLIGVQDGQAGADRLEQALDAGYANTEKLSALADAPDLADAQTIRALLNQRGFLHTTDDNS